jgi:hypothetical protein
MAKETQIKTDKNPLLAGVLGSYNISSFRSANTQPRGESFYPSNAFGNSSIMSKDADDTIALPLSAEGFQSPVQYSSAENRRRMVAFFDLPAGFLHLQRMSALRP